MPTYNPIYCFFILNKDDNIYDFWDTLSLSQFLWKMKQVLGKYGEKINLRKILSKKKNITEI